MKNVSEEELLALFNNLHEDLEFTIESSSTHLPFLDVLIKVEGRLLETTIYHKPTDSFNYLHFRSNHPAHIKRNIPYSLARRLKGIVSKQDDRLREYLELRKRLLTKFYPKDLINDAIIRAEKLSRDEILGSKKSNTERITRDITTLVTTHNCRLDQIGAEITKKVNDSKLDCLQSSKLIHGKRQPPNLNRLLTKTSGAETKQKIVTKKHFLLKKSYVIQILQRHQ